MAGPWERYQRHRIEEPEDAGPWMKYRRLEGQPRREFSATKLLPTVGAIGMGLAAGSGVGLPAAVGLTALGGAGGEAYRQIIERFRGSKEVPKTYTEAAKQIGIEGLKQGAYEAVGRPIAGAVARGATGAAGKALGFTKRFLNTGKKMRASREASKAMLEEGVITPLAGTEKMLERVGNIKNRAGENIGQFLKARGIGFDPKRAIAEIEKLRPQVPAGKPGQSLGHLDEINSSIDQAVNTIKAYGDGPIPFETANEIKGLLQSVTDFGSTKAKQELQQAIAGRFREVLDDTLEGLSGLTNKGAEFAQFIKSKKLYQAASKAEEGLRDKMAAETGNKAISLTDWLSILGGAGVGGAYGSGGTSVAGVASAYLVKKLAEKFGPQTAAVIGRQVSKNPGLLPTVLRAVGVSMEEIINASR